MSKKYIAIIILASTVLLWIVFPKTCNQSGWGESCNCLGVYTVVNVADDLEGGICYGIPITN